MTDIRTVTRICNAEKAKELVVRLVLTSAWFDCVPLPDDEYAIRVKADRAATLLEE